jgi:spore coat protein CotH
MGGPGGAGERPEGMEPPEGMSGDMRGGPGGSNVLVERFTAVEEWADLVEQAKVDLTESLYASGFADDAIDRWADLLTTQAGDLVDADAVAEEADAVRDVVASKVE